MHCKRVTLCVKILTMEYDETLMKIAVCDDEQKDYDDLFLLIQNYLQNNGFNFEIHMFSTGDKLLKTLADNHFSLLFLYIYLSSEEASSISMSFPVEKIPVFTPSPSFMQRLLETALYSTPQKETYGLIWRLIGYCKIWVCHFYVVTKAIL